MNFFSVHGEGDEVVRVHGLVDRHAARDRQFALLARQMGVRAFMGSVNRVLFDARCLQNIRQTHTGPFRTGNGAKSPLVAAGRRVERRAAIAAAFDDELFGHDLEFALEIGDAEVHRIVDQPVEPQLPAVCLHVFRNDAVIADKMAGRRRNRVVQQMRGCFRIDRAVVQDGQAVLTGNFHWIGGKRFGNEARGHVAVKRDGGADQRAHARKAGAFQETAPVLVRFASENNFVGVFGVFRVKFEKVCAFVVCLLRHVRSLPDLVLPVG